jgi:hypothetical protein
MMESVRKRLGAPPGGWVNKNIYLPSWKMPILLDLNYRTDSSGTSPIITNSKTFVSKTNPNKFHVASLSSFNHNKPQSPLQSFKKKYHQCLKKKKNVGTSSHSLNIPKLIIQWQMPSQDNQGHLCVTKIQKTNKVDSSDFSMNGDLEVVKERKCEAMSGHLDRDFQGNEAESLGKGERWVFKNTWREKEE